MAENLSHLSYLSPVQTDATLLAVACCVRLHTLLHVVGSWCAVKRLSQQLPTFLLFHDRRSVAQQCWIRLHSSSKIFGATHAHYIWSPKFYGLYPFHDALQVPTLLGVCIRLHTTANTAAITPNIVGPIMSGVVASVCV